MQDWLYQNIHIWHHKIFITYASGALYQHPAEMLMMDMCSGLVAVKATGDSLRTLTGCHRYEQSPAHLPLIKS